MAFVEVDQLLPQNMELDVECAILLWSCNTMVQPSIVKSAVLHDSVHSGPGTVASQRNPFPAQKLSHSHSSLSAIVALEAHLKIENAFRNQARYRVYWQRHDKTPEQDLELWRQRPAWNAGNNPRLPISVPHSQWA